MDIFEAFDELLVLKPGGVCVYFGPLGWESQALIAYFQASCSCRSAPPAACRACLGQAGWQQRGPGGFAGCDKWPGPASWHALQRADSVLCTWAAASFCNAPRRLPPPPHTHTRVQAVPGVAPCPLQYNPANWMLEQTSPAYENKLGLDFGEIYKQSATCK